jgi:hypothetical protein
MHRLCAYVPGDTGARAALTRFAHNCGRTEWTYVVLSIPTCCRNVRNTCPLTGSRLGGMKARSSGPVHFSWLPLPPEWSFSCLKCFSAHSSSSRAGTLKVAGLLSRRSAMTPLPRRNLLVARRQRATLTASSVLNPELTRVVGNHAIVRSVVLLPNDGIQNIIQTPRVNGANKNV